MARGLVLDARAGVVVLVNAVVGAVCMGMALSLCGGAIVMRFCAKGKHESVGFWFTIAAIVFVAGAVMFLK